MTVSAIFDLYGKSLGKARALLDALLRGPLPPEEPAIRTALAHSMLTPDGALSEAQRQWLAVLCCAVLCCAVLCCGAEALRN